MSRQKPTINPAFVVVIIISLLLITGLIKNAVGLYQSRSRLESAQASVDQLESEKQTLEKNIALQSDPLSIDQSIRNQLNLALPGDTVVVITGTEAAAVNPGPTPSPAPPPPYLQWWHLFNP